jgi:hypothetical protein
MTKTIETIDPTRSVQYAGFFLDYDKAGQLRAPFAPGEVQFKPSRDGLLAYSDARTVRNRLNDVFGWQSWESRMIQAHDSVICELTCNGVTKTDVGWCHDHKGNYDPKGAASDALKRAAFSFQVGEFLYDLPAHVTDTISYTRWLQTKGVKEYGCPPGCEELMLEQDRELFRKVVGFEEMSVQITALRKAGHKISSLVEEICEDTNWILTTKPLWWNAQARAHVLDELRKRLEDPEGEPIQLYVYKDELDEANAS